MLCESHAMKVYPPKSSSGAKASDRLQEYLMQSNPSSSDLHFSMPHTASRGHHSAGGALASIEAALIDNHVQAPALSSYAVPADLASKTRTSTLSSELPTKERWKKFAIDVLTCIPQHDRDQACEGFLEAMKELMSQPYLKEHSSTIQESPRLIERSSSNAQNLSWSNQQAPSVSSVLFDESRIEHDVMPRLEELLHILRSPR
jgi:hypothetical protein